MRSTADHARLLLAKADDDAYVVNRLVADPVAPEWVIGFHAQQAVEKALKAVLVRHGIEFPRTHNIAMLVELLRRGSLPIPPDAEDLPLLTPFGVTQRYDDVASDGESALDRSWAAAVVARTLTWAAD